MIAPLRLPLLIILVSTLVTSACQTSGGSNRGSGHGSGHSSGSWNTNAAHGGGSQGGSGSGGTASGSSTGGESAGGADTNGALAAAIDYDTFVNPTTPYGISEGTGWAILNGTSGQEPIQVRNMRTYYLSSSNQWVEAQSSDTGRIDGTYLDQGDTMPIDNNGNGIYTIYPNSQDVGPGTGSGHFWLSPHGIFPSDVKGVFVTVDARGSSNYTIEMGFDWWPNVLGKFDPAAAGYQGGSSNPQQLGSSWKRYAFSSVLLDVLRSNPPPGF